MSLFEYGCLCETPLIFSLPLMGLLGLGLGFIGARLYMWTLYIFATLYMFGAPIWLFGLFGAPLVIMNIPPLRQMVVSSFLLRIIRSLNFMPTISDTERTALEAGATWIDADLFSGKPDFKKINQEVYPSLPAEEQKFLDGPCEAVCRMFSDWDVYKNGDLPKEVWDYLKKERFFGMIVPKQYGGLEFSGLGHSEVIGKLSSKSIPLGITVMVPNSLGPAELINHYGTDDQKQYYLPRLASGDEIPCFALTEPNAGSDAGSIQSSGEVFRGEDGKIYIKLNWEKRYITLAAVATLIGLAVRLRDPDNLLGKGEDVGITCVLVPADREGVVLGLRHNPMGVPFYNCPTTGKDVVVPIDQVIGGQDGCGRGWTMLMESLAAGRAISLPAQATALSKAACGVTSAYAVVRRQFGIPIGKFEGIEEPLAEITGLTYMMEGARKFTCGAVDSGVKPAVVSAIMKYNSTELSRLIVNRAMDIVGGAGISRGPRNVLAHAYIANPISITVEGANILTRTMIIFGQGALRCHPFAYNEFKAIGDNDLPAFDRAFWGHIGFVVRNTCRSVLLSLTRGRLANTPGGPAKRYYQKLAWSSAVFALFADMAMGVLGGRLKFKEKLTGRYADVLMWMYFASCALRRFEAEGRPKAHEEVLQYAMEYAFDKMQQGFDGIFANFEAPVLSALFKGPIAFWSRMNCLSSPPSDGLGHRISKKVQQPGEFRDSLAFGYYQPQEDDPAGNIERAFHLVFEAESILKKISAAVRSKTLPKDRPTRLVDKAVGAGVISEEEAALLRRAEVARNEAITVDSFSLEEFQSNLMDPLGNHAKTGS